MIRPVPNLEKSFCPGDQVVLQRDKVWVKGIVIKPADTPRISNVPRQEIC
jgi:hypothetical protein